jgi:hypothetical protein
MQMAHVVQAARLSMAVEGVVVVAVSDEMGGEHGGGGGGGDDSDCGTDKDAVSASAEDTVSLRPHGLVA